MSDLFTQIVVLSVVASVFLYLANRLGQSVIIGYILAGLFLGPAGLAIINDPEQIKWLAELGIILLMFSVGIEFGLEQTTGINRNTILIGVFQIVASLLVGRGIGQLLGLLPGQGFFLGCVLALSSTAIVFKFLSDHGSFDTVHGKMGVGILILQDLSVIPIMLFLPVLAQTGWSNPTLLLNTALKTALLIAGLIAYGRFILPWLMDRIAHLKQRETLVIATLSHCFGVTWIAGHFGMSLALGAFLSGFILNFTQYSHQAVSHIIPFRDGFVGLFFISIGILLNPAFLLEQWTYVGALSLGIILVKFLLITTIVLLMGYPFRIASLTGLMLAQIGEFSFLLTHVGREVGIIGEYGYQMIISATVITMLMTPIIIRVSPRLTQALERFFRLQRLGRLKLAEEIRKSRIPSHNHVVICGFGPSGQNLATVLEHQKIPFCVLELNPQRVKEYRAKKMPILYADAANPDILKLVGIHHARALVIAFPDPLGITHIIQNARRLNPDMALISRTRFDSEVPKLYELGVDFVVIEELEASLELAQLLLKSLEIPKENITEDLKFLRDRKEAVISKAILESQSES
jgi:monovalent cation:H+ antiporter-2, CPA2 family